MSGTVEIPFYFLILTAVLAAITDLLWGKIVNALTIPSLMLGLLFHWGQGGWSGAGFSALGILAGFLLYGWIYALRHLGAGDVKLLMAFGAWGGPLYCAEVAVMGVLFGGALAALSLIWRGRASQFLIKCRALMQAVLWRLPPLVNFQFDRSLKIPLGIAIGAAALLVAGGVHPLKEGFGHLGWEKWIWP